MVNKSMADALAEVEQTEEQFLSENKQQLLQEKKRALLSDKVTAFIKQGPKEIVVEQPEERERYSFLRPVQAQLNIRVPAEIVNRLKRAAVENKISRLGPPTVQQIVIHAVEEELKRLGF